MYHSSVHYINNELPDLVMIVVCSSCMYIFYDEKMPVTVQFNSEIFVCILQALET